MTGSEIRERREHLLITQVELATMAGISFGYLAQIERGTYEPKRSNVIDRIALALAGAKHSGRSSLHRGKERATHCIHGHPYDAENTYISPQGKKNCKTCVRANSLRGYRKRREGVILRRATAFNSPRFLDDLTFEGDEPESGVGWDEVDYEPEYIPSRGRPLAV